MGQSCVFPFHLVVLLNDHDSEEPMRKSVSSLISPTKGQSFTLFWRSLILMYDLASPTSTRRWSTYTLTSHMWRCVWRARLVTIRLIFDLSQTKCGYACSDQLSDPIALAPAKFTLTTYLLLAPRGGKQGTLHLSRLVSYIPVQRQTLKICFSESSFENSNKNIHSTNEWVSTPVSYSTSDSTRSCLVALISPMSLALLICWSSLNSRLLLPWNWGVTKHWLSKHSAITAALLHRHEGYCFTGVHVYRIYKCKVQYEDLNLSTRDDIGYLSVIWHWWIKSGLFLWPSFQAWTESELRFYRSSRFAVWWT